MPLNLPNLGDSILEYDIEQTNEINKDSGWINLNQYIKYRKVGKMVTVVGTSAVNGYAIGNSVTRVVGTLPQGYRPDLSSVTCQLTRSGGLQNDSFATLLQAGHIALYSKGTDNTYWGFTITYPV